MLRCGSHLQISEDAYRYLFFFQARATPFKNKNILIGFRYPERQRRELLVFSYHSINCSGTATEPSLSPRPFNTTYRNFSRSNINFHWVFSYVFTCLIYFLVSIIVGLVVECGCYGRRFLLVCAFMICNSWRFICLSYLNHILSLESLQISAVRPDRP